MSSSQKNKYNSSLIKKKCKNKGSRRRTCCGNIETKNVSKPMRGSVNYCNYIDFYKSRNKMVLAKVEIRDIMKNY